MYPQNLNPILSRDPGLSVPGAPRGDNMERALLGEDPEKVRQIVGRAQAKKARDEAMRAGGVGGIFLPLGRITTALIGGSMILLSNPSFRDQIGQFFSLLRDFAAITTDAIRKDIVGGPIERAEDTFDMPPSPVE